MKILHVVHNYPPEFRGGTEIYLQALCRAQAVAGAEVVVLSGSEQRDWRDDLKEEVEGAVRVLRFYRVPGAVEEFGVDFHLERLEGLFRELLDRERPDVVHLHHWMNLGNELLAAAAEGGVPSVLTLHDLYPLCPRFFMTRPDGTACDRGFLSREACLACTAEDAKLPGMELEGEFRVRRESFRQEFAVAGAVIVPSRIHAEPYVAAGLLREGAYHVLPHGLVRPVAGPVWKPNPDRPLRAGTWGNLVRAKGIHVLLEAVGRARAEVGDRLEVHLFGPVMDGTYEEELHRLAEAAGGGVEFHGPFEGCSPEEMAEGLDVAVFPSLARESYSLVLDEAVALGLPVVVSDAGALPERVGEGGVVCPAGDAVALAEALVALERDREALGRMSRVIRSRAFTVEDNRREVDRLYRGVIAAGPRPVFRRSVLARTALLKGKVRLLESRLAEEGGEKLRFTRFRGFVPLRSFHTLPRGRALILAPHPDDEVIGCGGVTALHARRGDPVTVVHLTDGAGRKDAAARVETARRRRREAEAAGAVLGTEEFIGLERGDGKLIPDEETVARVEGLIRDRSPAVVYAPSPFEIHPDHTAALFILLGVVERDTPRFKVLLYEVNEAMVPGFLVDISPVQELKDRALACFGSQIAHNDVRDKSMAGARWRTANVDLPEVTHCEAFIDVDRSVLRPLAAGVKHVVELIEKGARPGHEG